MPRSSVPAYRLHKASGQARVILDGRHIYLGPHGSDESRERYARLIAERFTSPLPAAVPSAPCEQATASGGPLTVSELLVAYLRHARVHYSRDGVPTKEFVSMKEASRTLRTLFGSTPASEFGPKRLKALREHLVRVKDLSRKVVNARINRVRRIFRWAASEELVPVAVYQALRTVDGLRAGRTEARETEPVRPAADTDVEAVLSYVAPQVAAMVRLQRLTGMRPNEVVQIRPSDVDRASDVWVFEPRSHKTLWRGHRRRIPIGPRGQAVLLPFLDRLGDRYCFSPAEAEGWRYENRPPYSGRARTTKAYPSELRRREQLKAARRRRAGRAKRDRYDVDSYRRAIEYGVNRARAAGATVSRWSPNQLRHSRATEVRHRHGIEAAQVVLGHATADVTQVYAERDFGKAVRLAREEG